MPEPRKDGIENALKEKRKIDLKDVFVDFYNYNFIIKLNHITIDTTRFNGCYHHTGELVGILPSRGTTGWLVLTSKKVVGQNIGSTVLSEDETRIVIFDENVDSISVKSKRNFLLNQYEGK